MENCRSVQTPIDSKAPLIKADGSQPPHERTLYQQMIGFLMYLVTCTRPDLAFSVSFLSRFSSHPLKCHYTAVKRVFRYIAGTRFLSLKYHQSLVSVPLELYGFSDADYASCRDTRRSVTRYVFLLDSCTISWFSKKQNSVSASTTESEYMALSITARQALWYLNAFTHLGYSIPVHLRVDNTSSIYFAETLVNNARTKHIDVAYHFTREQLLRNSFTISYVPTGENTADIMTKGLPPVIHYTHMNSIGLTECERVLRHTFCAL